MSGIPDVDMVLGVAASKSGKSVQGYAVSHHTVDVDETSFFYSTDFPAGGTESRDYDDNETLENPSTNSADFLKDYRFENLSGGRAWSAPNINGKNGAINAPRNFDANNGGFVSGVYNATTPELANGTAGATIAQWGEDKNFNGYDHNDANTADSWFSFNETVTFGTFSGAQYIYPTNTASDLSTADVDYKAWTSRGT